MVPELKSICLGVVSYSSLCFLLFFLREDFGFEDGDSEERGPTILNENVYGIKAFFHLPDEVYCSF